MKLFLNIGIGFVGGITFGFFVGQKITKKKYENLADEEVESVKKTFEKFQSERAESNIKESSKKEKEDLIDYSEHLPVETNKTEIGFSKKEMEEYIDYSKPYRGTPESENRIAGEPLSKREGSFDEGKLPYLITPEEFADSHYESKSLFYYVDKVLTDDDYNVILNPEELLGPDALENFGMYESDAIHIRDDSKGMDYEVLLDERHYKKVKASFSPKKTENFISLDED